MTQPSFTGSYYACAIEMMNNALYIQRELPSLKVPDPLRIQIEELCDEWIGCKHDVISELGEISECLGEGNDARASRKEMMVHGWLVDSARKPRSCVEAFYAAHDAEIADPALVFLILESATNVLDSVPPAPTPKKPIS